MMTLRENAMAIYYGEKPDFYGDLMDAVELIPDPVLMGDLPPQDGLEHKDSWGTVYVFKPGAPGPHPRVNDSNAVIKDIEHGIYEAELGLTPQNDGEIIRIMVPALTEDRRREFAKQVWKFAENAKVSIRNIRRDSNDEIKKVDGSEDEIKAGQEKVQKLTDKFVKEIDEIAKVKEKEIMTV